MRKFLDVNVWLPLLWKDHPSSRTAQTWVQAQSEEFVICRVTQLAILRHLTNPKIMGANVLSNTTASRAIKHLINRPWLNFETDPSGILEVFPLWGHASTPQQKVWTVAYLAAFAISGHYELVSFDRGFKRFEAAGLHWTLLASN